MQDKFGDCLVPKRYWEDYQLGDWGHRMRAMLRDKSLKVDHFKALDRLSFPWTVPMVSLVSGFLYKCTRNLH